MPLTQADFDAVLLTLKLASLTTVLLLLIGTPIAWWLARTGSWLKQPIGAIVALPLVLPPVVTGWLLLLLFGMNGPIGRWLSDVFGITLLFRWTGAALAAAIMALPLMVRAMRLSIAAIDHRLEQAAQTLGASAVRIFCTISLPLALPGIFAGAMLGFARSIGEFGATITFVSDIPGETRTLPIAIYSALQLPDSDHVVLRLALLSVALSFAALLLSEYLARRAMAAGRSHDL